MNFPGKTKTLRSALCLISAVLLFAFSGLTIPVMDHATSDYFNKAITKAGLAYAACRAVNASVSILKESELQLEPAGIGISLAVGQVLDPIDDLTERLSDVLVTAITSLGIQKLAYEICISLAPGAAAIILVLLSGLIFFNNPKMLLFSSFLVRILLLVIAARFCLPLSSMGNDLLYKHFFESKISHARSGISLGAAEIDNLRELSLPEVDGVLGTIENSSEFLKKKSAELKDAFLTIIGNMEAIIENLLQLTFLYVGIFLIQVILLPLAIFWVLARTTGFLFPPRTASASDLTTAKK